MKNAKKYKCFIKNLETNKTIYSKETQKRVFSFPGNKNNRNASYIVTITGYKSLGKAIGRYKTLFHTGKIVVDTTQKINTGTVLYSIKNLKTDLVGIAWNGIIGIIQDDGTLRVSGE